MWAEVSGAKCVCGTRLECVWWSTSVSRFIHLFKHVQSHICSCVIVHSVGYMFSVLHQYCNRSPTSHFTMQPCIDLILILWHEITYSLWIWLLWYKRAVMFKNCNSNLISNFNIWFVKMDSISKFAASSLAERLIMTAGHLTSNVDWCYRRNPGKATLFSLESQLPYSNVSLSRVFLMKSRWSFRVHKTFLELRNKTALQHSPQVPICISCWGECFNTVSLWSSRNVLWHETSPDFPSTWGWVQNDGIFCFMVNMSLKHLVSVGGTLLTLENANTDLEQQTGLSDFFRHLSKTIIGNNFSGGLTKCFGLWAHDSWFWQVLRSCWRNPKDTYVMKHCNIKCQDDHLEH